MQESKTANVTDFFKANKIYYLYLLISHISLIFATMLFWMLTYQINQGIIIYWKFCIGYLILYLPIIPFSINIYKKSHKLNENFKIKDIRLYGQHKLISNICIAGLAIYFLIRNILLQYFPFDSSIWLVNPLDPLRFLYNPFTSDMYIFIAYFVFSFFTTNQYIFASDLIIPFFVLAFFVIGLMLNVSCNIRLRRILLRIVRDEDDRLQMVNLFKKFYGILIIFFIALIISFISLGIELIEISVYDSESGRFFSNLTGVVLFYFFMLYTLISIFKKMESFPLNPNFQTLVSEQSYKLERDITFSEHAIFFESSYVGDYIKESIGLTPAIGVFMIPVGCFSTFIFLMSLSGFVSSWLSSSDFQLNWILFNLFLLIISILIVLVGIFMPPRFFQMERTPTEMIFQKGYKKDHIPLAQLQEIALDYDFINKTDAINTTSVKLRITIALLIPNHTICIARNVKMDFIKNNQESFESQLVKVLTRTLFILGYTTNN